MSKLGEFLSAAYSGEIKTVQSMLNEQPKLAQRVSEGPGLDVFDRDVAAIHLAAFNGNIQLMQLLVDHGADFNASGSAGTPLFQATVANKEDAVFWLLKQGSEVNYRHPNGETALHIAAYVGNPRIVQALIEQGATVNVATTEGSTDTLPGSPPVMGEYPLHLAAAYGHLEVIRMLLKAGADSTLTDKCGANAGHWAGRYQQDQIRRMLA